MESNEIPCRTAEELRTASKRMKNKALTPNLNGLCPDLLHEPSSLNVQGAKMRPCVNHDGVNVNGMIAAATLRPGRETIWT